MKNLNRPFSSNWLGSAESRIRRKLLVVFFVFIPMIANAYDDQVEGIYYKFNSYEMTAEVIKGYFGYEGSIVIPETVTYFGDIYSVTSIAEEAFCYCNLTSVTIPNSITSIGDYAFYGCWYLKEIHSYMEEPCFFDEDVFESEVYSNATLFIPHGTMDKYMSTNYWNNFINISDMETEEELNVETHEDGTATVLGYKDKYKNQEKLIIPETIALNGNEYLVTRIGDGAFEGCYSLTSIEIPYSVESIGESAFSGCTSLASVELPYYSSLTSIGKRAFENCSSLTYISIPNSVTSIEDYAFCGCSLNIVIFPSSVKSIGKFAFKECSCLQFVTIPNSVTSIGNYAFEGCSYLREICSYMEEPCSFYINTFDYEVYSNAELIIPYGTMEKYKSTYCWAQFTSITVLGAEAILDINYNYREGTATVRGFGSDYHKNTKTLYIPEKITRYDGKEFTVTSIDAFAFRESKITSVYIPNSVTDIGHAAFEGCYDLASVTIPNSVTSIGYSAFEGCSSLSSVVIPNSLTSISDDTFRNCYGLTSITIQEGVSSIGKYAFSGCSITSIAIPNSVTSIGVGAFYNCHSLTSIIIPNSVISIGNSVFEGCSNLASVSFSSQSSLESISERAFCECSSLTAIDIPNSVTSIGNNAFVNCNSLTSVTIPNSMVSIGKYAFMWCKSLTSVTIPNSVMSIGNYVFLGCSALTSIKVDADNPNYSAHDNVLFDKDEKTLIFCAPRKIGAYIIPNTVLSISEQAFYGCSNLTSVTIPNTVLSISERAFYGCSNLTSVTIPNSVVSIGSYAFSSCDNLASVTIPNSVEIIDNHAFSSCDNLASVTIPNSVATIGYEAFAFCHELSEIISYISVPFVIGEDVFYAWGVNDRTLYVPQGTAKLYKNTAGWNKINNIVEIEMLSDSEWASLQKLYNQIAPTNTEWSKKWQNVISKGKISQVRSLDGLTIEDGHVVGIDLSNQKLAGQFPSILLTFPNVKKISLNGNHFGGDIQTIIEELSLYVTNNDPSFVSELQSLDLSGNNLTGNIGALAYSTETTPSILSRFPSLKTLKASNNKFEDIYPALPASITNLDISNQKMDRVVELNMSDLSLEDFSSKVPTILLYDKVNRTYKNSINLLCTKADLATFNKYNTKEWAMQLQIDDNQLSIPYVSAQKEYHGESGDTLNVLNMMGNDATDGSSFRIALSFNQGDANFINGVDATDLQTTILYAFGGYRNYPFNFTAADTYKDGIINVQDVICTVNILLDSHNEQAMEARSKKVNMADMEAKPDTDAYLYVKDGKVFLHSRVPVASLSIKADGNVKWNIERLGLSQSTANGNVVAYSLNGTTIPSYEDVVLGECTHAKLYSVSLSDTDAQPISVNFGNSATSIINTSNATNGDMKIYDVSGYRLNKMRKGINIIRNNGTTKKIYK